MRPEAIRRAIAEVCGFTDFHEEKLWSEYELPGGDGTDGWRTALCGLYQGRAREVPDYPGDLNAMHEAEKVLTDAQRIDYAVQRLPSVMIVSGRSVRSKREEFRFVHATAAQRAEAFLRTIGKWEDDQ